MIGNFSLLTERLCRKRFLFIVTVLVLEILLVWGIQKFWLSRSNEKKRYSIFRPFVKPNCYNQQEACREAGSKTGLPNYNPGIAFIVVSKRINTRFFKMDGRGPSNPSCGTVVDNKVTLNERFDFFLISQKVTQGTVSPTSYNVVEDTTGTPPDIHQRLAYALTHLYYNWAVITMSHIF